MSDSLWSTERSIRITRVKVKHSLRLAADENTKPFLQTSYGQALTLSCPLDNVHARKVVDEDKPVHDRYAELTQVVRGLCEVHWRTALHMFAGNGFIGGETETKGDFMRICDAVTAGEHDAVVQQMVREFMRGRWYYTDGSMVRAVINIICNTNGRQALPAQASWNSRIQG